jgi:gliding motility-associated-like protein
MKIIKHILIFLVLSATTPLFSQIICDFKADTNIICVNTSLQFTDLSTAGSIQSWEWDFGNGLTSSVQNPTVIYTDPGTYSVSLTITDTSGNAYKMRHNYIIVRELPTADFTFSLSKDNFMNDTISLSSFSYWFSNNSILPDNMGYKYFWNFGDGLYTDTIDSLSYIFDTPGDYIVSFVVEAGLGCTDTATFTVKVEDVFDVSNVFTPNGDGINDLLLIKTNGVNTYNMIIFNRWGNIVHVIDAKKLIWDGYSSAGVPLEQGTYYFHIESEELPEFSYSGFIYLFR